MNRKQRRIIAKDQRKKGKEDLAEKMMLFDKLPEQCYMCEGDFDKTNTDMIKSWNVVVKESESRVTLYCPTCWTMAQEMVTKVIESMQEVGEKLE